MEEIDELNQHLDGTNTGYKEAFSNLPRCMALMVSISVSDKHNWLTEIRSTKRFVFLRPWHMWSENALVASTSPADRNRIIFLPVLE
jgi:hypothetical protein